MKNLSQFSNLVDSFEIGNSGAAEMFQEDFKTNNIGIERAVDEEGNEYKVTSYECYVDSGSVDYYYYQLAELV